KAIRLARRCARDTGHPGGGSRIFANHPSMIPAFALCSQREGSIASERASPAGCGRRPTRGVRVAVLFATIMTRGESAETTFRTLAPLLIVSRRQALIATPRHRSFHPGKSLIIRRADRRQL